MKTFKVREYSTGDFGDMGREKGVVQALDKERAWNFYMHKNNLSPNSRGFYEFEEVIYKDPNIMPNLHEKMIELMELGKKQGIKVIVTFDKL